MADKKKKEKVDEDEVSADEVDQEEGEDEEGEDEEGEGEEGEDEEGDEEPDAEENEPPSVEEEKPKRPQQTHFQDFELPARITRDQIDMTIQPSAATKYLPKPKRIIIPFVLPWENTPAKETQKGMGAFGGQRNAYTKVDQGSKEMKQGELDSESVLTLFASSHQFASQKGGVGFGGHRRNVLKAVCTKELDNSRLQEGEGIIPKQAGNLEAPTQSGTTPMGALRRQVPNIKYKDDMTHSCDPESDTFIRRQLEPNPLNRAGTRVIDTRRNQVPDPLAVLKHSRKTEGIVPRLLDMSKVEPPTGTGAGNHGLGAFRQVYTPTKGGYDLSTEDVIASKRIVPWINEPRLSSQEGSGGFSKPRDAVNPVKYRL